VYRIIIVIVFSTASGLAVSANNLGAPEDCIKINSSEKRLMCYDKSFARDSVDQSIKALESVVTISPLEARRSAESVSERTRFALAAHKPNYFLPGTHNSSADYSVYDEGEPYLSNTEAKFQLSVKASIAENLWHDSSLSMAFTQVSYWQLFADDEASSPFRETNYEPELIWDVPINKDVLGFNLVSAGLRLNHQSNGRTRPLSRSWNRIIASALLQKGAFVFSAETWSRVEYGFVDENPDIEDFMGRAQFGLAYKGASHTVAVGIKNNLASENRSGVELNWSFPLNQQFRGFMQVYSGYGENMIDMENYNNRIGFGITLTDWL
jgi:phospholipase A1